MINAAFSAFTPVTARRTFGQPSVGHTTPPQHVSPPSTSTPGSARKRQEWPPAVRSYVQRSFADENMSPDVDRHEMEITLKQVISQSVEAGTLDSVDWDNLPLPQAMIQNGRRHDQNSHMSPRPFQSNENTISAYHETNKTTSKKRTSSSLDHDGGSGHDTAPWNQAGSRNAFESRISYPDKRARNDSKSSQVLDGRKKRFENTKVAPSPPRPWRASGIQEMSTEEPKGPIVGRCQDLEKKYFRLTSAPNPDTVRPLAVLEKTLEHLKKKWREEKNYFYICDQFKSLRQDLTVQHIKTGFTINAYEIHARIALEKGDLGEYNQCQTQLRALYALNLGGHPSEFMAYRILYFLHTSNKTDMNDALADLTPAEKEDSAVKHALATRSALALGNYHRFFQLFLDTPNMGAYLMDMFVARERLSALSMICRTYKPDVKLRFVTEELAFESDDECARFICNNGAEHFLEQRDDSVRLLTGKAMTYFEAALKAAAAPKT
ncbi:MAG: hypothetical protein Q9183_000638 [Haloplaca sp. 2 TL-2023]